MKPEDTVTCARGIIERAKHAAGNDPVEAREKIAEGFADMIGFIAKEAFNEPDGRELLSDVVKYASGARSSRDG